MSAAKSGTLFFVVFVSISAGQRVVEGHSWAESVVRDIVTALVAAVIFVALAKLISQRSPGKRSAPESLEG